MAVGSEPTRAYLVPGMYKANVTATDSNGYNATSSQSVYVATALSVGFTETFSSLQINKAVTIIATTNGGVGAVRLTWDFGDGSTGLGSIAIHTYTISGSYTVVLTGTDGRPSQLVAISRQLISVADSLSGSATGSTGQPRPVSLCLSRNIWIFTIAGAALLGLGSLVHVTTSRSRRVNGVPSSNRFLSFYDQPPVTNENEIRTLI